MHPPFSLALLGIESGEDKDAEAERQKVQRVEPLGAKRVQSMYPEVC